MHRRRALIALAVGFGVVLAPHVRAADSAVLVFGGAGRLGSDIVKGLLAKGDDVTVFVRPTSDRSRLESLDVSYAVGDVLNEAEVAAAFQEARFDTVINALAQHGSDPSPYAVGQKNISKWAKETRVQQAILVSSVGAGDNRKNFPITPLQKRYQDVAEAKGIAEAELISSGLCYTIIRMGMLLPYGTTATGQGRLTEDQTVSGPITRADLANLVVGCVANSECRDRIFHASDDSMPSRIR